MLKPLEWITFLLNLLFMTLLLLQGLLVLPASFFPFTLIGFGIAVGLSLIQDLRELRSAKDPWRWLKWHSPEIVLFCVGIPLVRYHVTWLGMIMLRQLFVVISLFARWEQGQQRFFRLLQHPAQLIVYSFGTLVTAGTLMLMLPIATVKRGSLYWLDALFTATSASCVTGLVVLDTPVDFTLFGQLVILTLIQAGGLGIMTISSFVMWSLGRRLGMRSRYALGEILDEPTPDQVLRLLRFVVFATLTTEIVGATILFFRWYDTAKGFWLTFYHSIFHAVSAFCNAGFALWSDSLMSFQTDVTVNVTIMALILIGGMGFPVLASLIDPERWQRFRTHRKKQSRLWSLRLFIHSLPVNTKLVLVGQSILVATGAILFFSLESTHSLSHLNWLDRGLASMFQSITLRTAGFNSVDFSLLSPATIFIMIFFMFIGGASGGTAGGIKLNTLYVILLSIRTSLRGRHDVEAFERSIPRGTVIRASGIFAIFIALFIFFFFLLLLTQSSNIPFAHLMFETVSALGTVGLTLSDSAGGTTGKLNDIGKVIVTVMMFIGRIGPLTLALAIGNNKSDGEYRYPRERVYVG